MIKAKPKSEFYKGTNFPNALLEQQIERIESAAGFVEKDGVEPRQQEELEAFLRQFQKRICPVIPVILVSALKEPQLPLFLEGRA